MPAISADTVPTVRQLLVYSDSSRSRMASSFTFVRFSCDFGNGGAHGCERTSQPGMRRVVPSRTAAHQRSLVCEEHIFQCRFAPPLSRCLQLLLRLVFVLPQCRSTTRPPLFNTAFVLDTLCPHTAHLLRDILQSIAPQGRIIKHIRR